MSPNPVTEARQSPGTVSPSRLALGSVFLTVNDLDRVRTFYEQVTGLHFLRGDGSSAELGVGDKVLLELRGDRSARRHSPREAGLFHIAFLLPTRADLARWTRSAIERRIPGVGASDHGVSEAIYLTDPEGNGVEIYADRPPESWRWYDGTVAMAGDALDVQDLLTSGGEEIWRGFPAGAEVGHVHLQVGDVATAEDFYAGVLGLDVTNRLAGATFYSADGYHHHIATNAWSSRGAGVRTYPSTGLAELQIHMESDQAEAARNRARQVEVEVERIAFRDPWDTAIKIVPVPVSETVVSSEGR